MKKTVEGMFIFKEVFGMFMEHLGTSGDGDRLWKKTKGEQIRNISGTL